MSLQRGIDGSGPLDPEPVGRIGAVQEERRVAPSTRVATGTLACPSCDAPAAPPRRPLLPADPLGCGFCGHEGSVRDFLSLAPPTRPTRVVVRVRARQPARRLER